MGFGHRSLRPFDFLRQQVLPLGPMAEPWVRIMDLMLHPATNTPSATNGFWTSPLMTSLSAELALR